MTDEEKLQSITAKLTGHGFYIGQRIAIPSVNVFATVVSLSCASPHWEHRDPKNRITVIRDGEADLTYPLRSVCEPL